MLDEIEFKKILEQLRTELLELGSKRLSLIGETEFEEVVFDKVKKLLPEHEIFYQKGSTSFPDIGIGLYGVEVKTVKGDSWVSTGNSINEGTKRWGVEKIYIVFLKKGGTPDIIVKKYEDCLSDIKVTHMPRYEINMCVAEKGTIFEKIKTTYEKFIDLEIPEKIRVLRKYYLSRSEGKYPYWVDPESGESVTPMSVKSYTHLSPSDKADKIVELFSLFPEVIRGEYDEAATYLLSKHSVFNKSFRDMFSAGGRIVFDYKGGTYNAPQVISHLLKYLKFIVPFIKKRKSLCEDVWEKKFDNDVTAIDYWIDKIGREFELSGEKISRNGERIKLNDVIRYYIEKLGI